jgi:hypothetical protein
VFELLTVLAIGTAAWSAEGRQFVRPRPPETTPAQKAGWWIRVNPANEATQVSWRFGALANRLSAPMTWMQGKSPEALDAPQEQRGAEHLHLAVLGMPPASPVSFCVFFADRGVALVEFTQETTLEVEREQTADTCVP